MHFKLSHLVGVMAVLLMSSCSHRLTDFTVISTKNVPIGENTNYKYVKGDKRVKGVDKTHVVLYIPLGTPNLKEAIDRAIETTPNAIGLVDGVVKSNNWWALFYGQSSYIVEGTPLYAYETSDEAAAQNGDVKSAQYLQEQYFKRGYEAAPAQQKTMIMFYHEVKAGESLKSIAEQYNVSISDIIKWNKLSNSNLVRGAKLELYILE